MGARRGDPRRPRGERPGHERGRSRGQAGRPGLPLARLGLRHRAPGALAGRVRADPGGGGEAAVATVELEPRSLHYWSVDDHAWRTEPGEYAVQVGTSVATLGEPIRFTV
ncbi:fibronectin type III-like domain-contianing protein [Leifsonia sp. L25]|uniref:fibronectin type III-like domain-contianing protein n=1 Tax=Actinomycetes TaxID=1760 RepID=UPI003D6900C7